MTVLEEFGRLSGSIYVGGELHRSNATAALDVVDPATENVIGQIAEMTREEIDAAVDIAKGAQVEWWGKSALERSETMHEVANINGMTIPVDRSNMASPRWLFPQPLARME